MVREKRYRHSPIQRPSLFCIFEWLQNTRHPSTFFTDVYVLTVFPLFTSVRRVNFEIVRTPLVCTSNILLDQLLWEHFDGALELAFSAENRRFTRLDCQKHR